MEQVAEKLDEGGVAFSVSKRMVEEACRSSGLRFRRAQRDDGYTRTNGIHFRAQGCFLPVSQSQIHEYRAQFLGDKYSQSFSRVIGSDHPIPGTF
jgi:hypothetical protein